MMPEEISKDGDEGILQDDETAENDDIEEMDEEED
jgi:hypothetical protein